MAFLKKPTSRYLVLAFVGILTVGIASVTTASKNNVYNDIKTYNRILANVYDKYVEDVDSKDLIYSSIEGMMASLDPHSAFLEKKQYDDLLLDTQGKYGGVGISIDVRDEWLTVVSPIEGTPAYNLGLRAGDKIIAIEEESTKGITTAEAAQKLRGPEGTAVTITISRPGELVPFDVEIVRAVIELKSVPYVGVLRDGIGYLRLTQFSEESGKEVQAALEKLLADGAKGVVFDLRRNHGGLLTQAVAVSDKFLDRGRLISYTQGRLRSDRSEYYASEAPAIPANVPVVVLVDGSTASASEIVAGALQDDGRAAILGELTYGKGLVQTLIPLDTDANLKLTTAKWYTPAGRCIQKEWKDADDDEELEMSGMEIDEPEQEESETEAPPTGGILPDIVMEQERTTRYAIELVTKNCFFRYAVQYARDHPKLPRTWRIDAATVEDFRSFLASEEFDYESAGEIEIGRLREYSDREGFDPATLAALDALERRFEAEKQNDFDANREFIETRLEREVMAQLHGEHAMYEAVLRRDPQTQAAVDLLLDKDRYEGIVRKKEAIASVGTGAGG